MESSRFGNLIRTGKSEILSCTITNLIDKDLEFLDINFRKAVEKECGILFFEFKGDLYYPINMEFRLIDNNVLFLISELGINNFFDLCHLLKSSFKREEEREVDFFAVVGVCNNEPTYCHKLTDFSFAKTDKVFKVNVDE